MVDQILSKEKGFCYFNAEAGKTLRYRKKSTTHCFIFLYCPNFFPLLHSITICMPKHMYAKGWMKKKFSWYYPIIIPVVAIIMVTRLQCCSCGEQLGRDFQPGAVSSPQ